MIRDIYRSLSFCFSSESKDSRSTLVNYLLFILSLSCKPLCDGNFPNFQHVSA